MIDRKLEEFPEEIQLNIFSFFTERRDLLNTRLVCTAWNRISNDSYFWKKSENKSRDTYIERYKDEYNNREKIMNQAQINAAEEITELSHTHNHIKIQFLSNANSNQNLIFFQEFAGTPNNNTMSYCKFIRVDGHSLSISRTQEVPTFKKNVASEFRLANIVLAFVSHKNDCHEFLKLRADSTLPNVFFLFVVKSEELKKLALNPHNTVICYPEDTVQSLCKSVMKKVAEVTALNQPTNIMPCNFI